MIFIGVQRVDMVDADTGLEHVLHVLHLDRDEGRPDDPIAFEVDPADARRLRREFLPGQTLHWQRLAWLRPQFDQGEEIWPDGE